MSFYGCHFSFDGVPCEEFGLMLYDFGSPQDAGGSFASSGSVVEDRVSRRYRSFFYGTQQDKALDLSFVFGANDIRMNSNKALDRWDLEAISAWLDGNKGYCWLEIEQPDTETVRYRCRVSSLQFKTVGKMPWAFECKVVCDSPYGFTFPEWKKYELAGEENIIFHNRSTHNGYLYPKMKIKFTGEGELSIVNHSDNDRMFKLSGLPSGAVLEMEIDNENGIITNNLGLNLYPYFNFNFMRFVRGDNDITTNGNCVLFFICEFPVNIGG